MIKYKHHMPTPVYFGEDAIKENGYVMKQLGSKALIVTSKFPEGTVNLALEDVKAFCEAEGIEYLINDGVEANPTIGSINAIAKDAQAFQPEFIIAVGGGSAMDSAKGVSVLIGHPGEDPFHVFYDAEPHDDLIIGTGDQLVPLVAVPTTAGTGSEVGRAAVLTDERVGTKVSMRQRVFPDISYVDYRYIKSSPAMLLHASAMDALTHGVEGYLNNDSTIITRGYAMTGFSLFSQYKWDLYNNTLDDAGYELVAQASDIFGMGMMYSTTITHGMGYPLTHEKNVSHGLACAVFLGEFLRNFKNQELVRPIIDACGFPNVDHFADYVNGLLGQHVHFTCTMDEIEEWTDMMWNLKWRLRKNPEPLEREDIRNIYIRSLKNVIVD